MFRPLHIAIVTVADLPEGAGRTTRLKSLAAALVQMGHEVTIWIEHSLSTVAGQQPSGQLESGARFEYILGRTERRFGFAAAPMKIRAVYRLCARVRQARRAGRLDLLIINNLALYDTLPLTLCARVLGVRTVQAYEDARMEVVSTRALGLSRRIFGWNSWLSDLICPPLADAVIAISSHLEETYRAHCRGRCPVFLVPTIIDVDAWSGPEAPPDEPPLVLYCGAFSEADNVEVVLDALALVRAAGTPFRCRLVGSSADAPEVRALRRKAGNLGLGEQVEFLSFMPLAQVREQVFAANVLVAMRRDTPWSRSGQSTKLSEYLAAGRAVVAAVIGDNGRYLENGESALLVPADIQPPELARVFGQALRDRALRLRLGAGARRSARAHFDFAPVQATLAKMLGAIGLS